MAKKVAVVAVGGNALIKEKGKQSVPMVSICRGQ